MKLIAITLCCLALATTRGQAETPVKDVLAQVDAATGQPKDTTTAFTVSGIIAATLALPDGHMVAYIHNPGDAALPLLADAKDAPLLAPRNMVKVTGKLAVSPLGAGLQLDASAISVTATNQPFASTLITADALKDASSLAGKYVQLREVTFTPGKFDTSGKARAKVTDGTEITLLISKGAAGHEAPTGPNDVFGVVTRTEGKWALVAARFLSTNRKVPQGLALKNTCLTCHNPDTKLIGPPYREVAAKYRNDPEALAKLVAQMENGGSGKWGPVPMIAFKGRIPPEDMKTLGEWVLGFRWDALLAE
jgi:cytochrome c551/c552